jgi:thioredoxin-related protein
MYQTKHSSKALFVIGLCSLLLTLSFAKEATFISRLSYKQALELAQKEQKPLMLFFWSVYCEACEHLKTDVLSQATNLSLLDNNFVVAWIDSLNPTNKDLLKHYKVRGTPTLVFVAAPMPETPLALADGYLREIKRSYGATPEQFVELLTEVITLSEQ